MALTDKLTAIAGAIRGKAGGTEPLTLDQMAAEISGLELGSEPVLEPLLVSENGEYTPDDGVDGFSKVTVEVDSSGSAENLLDYAASLQGAFSGIDFGGGKDLTINFGSKTTSTLNPNVFNSIFQNAVGLKRITIIYGGTAISDIYFNAPFRSSGPEYELETIDLTQVLEKVKISNFPNAFQNRRGLKEVLGEMDASYAEAFNNFCAGCEALETIRFKAETIHVNISFSNSPNLTDETIQSIIDGLADMTDSSSQTLTLHANVGARLTDAQKAAAAAKNWTLAY